MRRNSRVALAIAVMAGVALQAPTTSVAQPGIQPNQGEPTEAKTSRDAVDWVVDIAQVTGIAAVAIGAAFAYRQLRDARHEARTERSLSFLERSASDGFRRLASATLSYIDVEP